MWPALAVCSQIKLGIWIENKILVKQAHGWASYRLWDQTVNKMDKKKSVKTCQGNQYIHKCNNWNKAKKQKENRTRKG